MKLSIENHGFFYTNRTIFNRIKLKLNINCIECIIYFEDDCTIDFNPYDLWKPVSAEARWPTLKVAITRITRFVPKVFDWKKRKTLMGKIKLQITFLSIVFTHTLLSFFEVFKLVNYVWLLLGGNSTNYEIRAKSFQIE